jgi:hypothetical protein
VVNSGSPGTFLSTVNIYDDKERVVQTQSQNYSQGINVTITQYSWAGQPLVTVQRQQKGGTCPQTTVTVSGMGYDNLNRLINTIKQLQKTLITGTRCWMIYIKKLIPDIVVLAG